MTAGHFPQPNPTTRPRPVAVAHQPVADLQPGIQEKLNRLGLGSLATVFDLLPCGLSIATDRSCREIIHNRAAATFFRTQPGDSFSFTAVKPMPLTVYSHGRRLSAKELPLQRAAWLGQVTRSEEFQCVWPDGTRRTGLWSVEPLRDEQGNILGAIATFEDLTELQLHRDRLAVTVDERTVELEAANRRLQMEVEQRQRIADQLQKSSQKTVDILESISDAFLAVDTDFNISYVNQGAVLHYRRPREELIGLNLNQLSPHFPHSEFRRQFLSALSSQQPVHFETFGNLSQRWMSVHAYPAPDGLSVFFRDITGRRNARAAMARLVSIVESSDAAIVYLDRQGIIRAWNPGAERMFGHAAEEAIDQSINLIFPAVEQAESLPLLERIVKGGKVTDYETVCRRRDGLLLEVLLIASPVRNNQGELVGESLIINDISERKRMEQEFLRLDRLDLAAQLAAGIGHEIRNPMTTVRGFLQFLSKKHQMETESEFFQLMIEELDRANAIITEFLSLAKGKPVDRQMQSLSDIVRQLEPLIQADATLHGHQLQLELSAVPNLLLEEKDIRQLLLNLVRNGLEAMPTAGRLTIRTVAAAGQVRLEVSDQGAGIAAEHLDKIYMPFFTTKETGTGLGLSVCYRIADQHGARIDISTSPRGTSFVVIFPCLNG